MARLRVGLLRGAEGEISLSRLACRRLDFSPGSPVRLRAGVKTTEARIRAGARPGHILLAPDVRQALALPVGLRLNLWRNREGVLRLGPLVAVLTFRGTSGWRWGPQTPFVLAVTRRGGSAGVVAYLLMPGRIDWENLTARGTYRQRGRWRGAVLPLPDVVYDRVSSRRHEGLPEVAEARRRLAEVVPAGYFPPSFLGKLEAHNLLASSPRLAPYLPATEPFSVDNLERMLSQYRVVYLKPDGGSLGRGIIRVRRLPGGRVAFRFARRGGGRARSPQALANRLKTLGQRPYLIQQGVPVATCGGRVYDVRVLAQKNSQGRWRVTRHYARVARRGRVVSNISRGGTGLGTWRVVRDAGARQTILQLGQDVPPALEAALGQPLGELGVDLGVTRDGRVFIIEVNAKPYRETWGWGSGPTFRYPLAYARHLARQT
ncbi:MAG: YheC/YheD family protein [bacterium]|nr:YheC/YheD family protein [bacterium]